MGASVWSTELRRRWRATSPLILLKRLTLIDMARLFVNDKGTAIGIFIQPKLKNDDHDLRARLEVS